MMFWVIVELMKHWMPNLPVVIGPVRQHGFDDPTYVEDFYEYMEHGEILKENLELAYGKGSRLKAEKIAGKENEYGIYFVNAISFMQVATLKVTEAKPVIRKETSI